MLTSEREFGHFKEKQLPDKEDKFDEAKSNLKMNLFHEGGEYWNPVKYSLWDT
jgi:hypothetical protein